MASAVAFGKPLGHPHGESHRLLDGGCRQHSLLAFNAVWAVRRPHNARNHGLGRLRVAWGGAFGSADRPNSVSGSTVVLHSRPIDRGCSGIIIDKGRSTP